MSSLFFSQRSSFLSPWFSQLFQGFFPIFNFIDFCSYLYYFLLYTWLGFVLLFFLRWKISLLNWEISFFLMLSNGNLMLSLFHYHFSSALFYLCPTNFDMFYFYFIQFSVFFTCLWSIVCLALCSLIHKYSYIFLLDISNWILMWPGNIFCMIIIIWNLLRFVLWSRVYSIL